MKVQKQPKRSLINGKLVIYSFIVFFVLAGSGEAIVRIPLIKNSPYLSINTLQQTGYGPAIDHFQRIEEYVNKNGPPQCIIIGSSLVQIGIAPDIFAEAFQATTGEEIRCYNVGMDGSTLSSTAPMIFLLSQQYHPLYVILGVQIRQFLPIPHNEPLHLAEDRFHRDGWIRYKLDHLNLEGWLLENSRLYSLLERNIPLMFPRDTSEPSDPNLLITTIRPEVPRMFDETGYAPLVGYRDDSPLFQSTNDVYSDLEGTAVDSQDIMALEQLLEHAKNGEFKLIIFEMPINDPSNFVDETIHQIESLVRQNGIPFLSTDGLIPLPETAYSDQIHMQMSGSYMFSEWLGSQIGEAVANGALSDVYDPIWVPTLERWDKSAFENTLGLNEGDYAKYLDYQDTFNLVPDDAIIFNPSFNTLDKPLAQSLVGFSVDWEAGITNQVRLGFFQLMILLGRMQYQEEFHLSSLESAAFEAWRTTLNPSILRRHAIQYVVCREELADPTMLHCPAGLADHPNYKRIGTWRFDPLYERYTLYQVVSTG